MSSTENGSFVDFGDVLQYYRTKEGLSQEQLAEGICTRVYVSQIEKNKQIPRLQMIIAFSNKLGVNLFDAYALIIEHNDFDTHKKIELLNEAINSQDDNRLFALATEYAALPGFSYGVPLQCIKYALALYYSNALYDYKKAVFYASEGLTVSGIPDTEMIPTPKLSVIDLCLLLVKSVNLCRCHKLGEGRKYLEYLYNCVKLRIEQNYHVADRNRRFDINLFAMTAFNICEFYPNNVVHNMRIVDDSIRLLNECGSSKMQQELLLYKARYLYDLGDKEHAENCFKAGYNLMICYKSKSAEEDARDILEERFDKLRQ